MTLLIEAMTRNSRFNSICLLHTGEVIIEFGKSGGCGKCWRCTKSPGRLFARPLEAHPRYGICVSVSGHNLPRYRSKEGLLLYEHIKNGRVLGDCLKDFTEYRTSGMTFASMMRWKC
jgi:hypothetical protein